MVFEVHKRKQVFYFEPLCSWKDPIAAESFSLEWLGTTWITKAAIDKDLFYQAVEEVEKLL